jgi:hypothetical protein
MDTLTALVFVMRLADGAVVKDRATGAPIRGLSSIQSYQGKHGSESELHLPFSSDALLLPSSSG